MKTEERQRQILAFIKSYTRANGYQPTLRETAVHLGLRSPSAVGYHLGQMAKAGLLTRGGGRAVAIRRRPLVVE